MSAVLEGVHYATGEPVRVSVCDGTIESVDSIGAADGRSGPWIGPGLVDLQVNGCRGTDLNAPRLTEEDVADVVTGLRREGVTAFLPTVVSNGDEAIHASVGTIAAACLASADVRASVLGIHLEGPFISPHDGPRGAHDREHVRPPEWDLFRRWQESAHGLIRVLTLSPEWPDACEFITRCVDGGVMVAIGHTAATPEQIRDAVAAGARLSTHLGNGAHPQLPRHPNYLWEQLASDELWASVIADGFHLPDAVLKVIMRVKGARVFVVSDAVALAGMEAGAYDASIGGSVVLTESGRLHVRESPELLAGSVRMLVEELDHLVVRRLAPLDAAWDMCSVRPSTWLGLPTSSGLVAGAPADLLVLERVDGHLRVLTTVKAGAVVFDAAATR